MSEWHPLSFSVEELALSVSLMGYPEDAAVLLSAYFGELSPEAAQRYLEAASHSLLARGWVVQENGTFTLAPTLREIVQGLASTKFSLYLQKRPRNAPSMSLTFHFGDTYVLSQTLSYDVVHQFSWLDHQDILPAGWAFFDVPHEQWEQGEHFGSIPSQAFQALYKAKTQEERETIAETIDLAPDVRKALLEDLAQASYRGLIVLLEYDEERKPYSHEGAFVLQGPNHTWLFASDESPQERLQVELMSLQSYQALIRRLLRKGAQHNQAQ